MSTQTTVAWIKSKMPSQMEGATQCNALKIYTYMPDTVWDGPDWILPRKQVLVEHLALQIISFEHTDLVEHTDLEHKSS